MIHDESLYFNLNHMRLTRNPMLDFVKFWDKFSLGHILKFLKFPSFHSGNFKNFKSDLGKFIPNFPHNHEITSTNTQLCVKNLKKIMNQSRENPQKPLFKAVLGQNQPQTNVP